MVSRRDELWRAAWGVAGAAMVFTACTWTPLFPSWVERLVPLRLHVAVAALVLALVVWFARRGTLALTWLAVAVLNGAWVPPRSLPLGPDRPADRPKVAPPLTVLTYNVNRDSVAYDELIDTLVTADADVVLLQEVTPKWKQNLVRVSDYNFRSVYPDDDHWGFAVLSRYPILSSKLLPWTGLATAYGIQAEIRMGGEQQGQGVTVTLVGLHLMTPVSEAGAAARDAQLEAAALVAKYAVGPVVVLGDLNTTPWSTQFHDLLTNAKLRDGAAWRWVGPTWPRLAGPLGIPIDHILVGGSADVDGIQVLDAEGSDHAPLVGRLAIWDGPGTR